MTSSEPSVAGVLLGLSELDHSFAPNLDVEAWAHHLQINNVLPLLIKARESYLQAASYRNFRVGVTVVGMASDSLTLHIIHGCNIKPQPESGPINEHAEQLELAKAVELGVYRIPILALIGDLQDDTQSGLFQHTLHPCGLCRDKLAASPLIDENTLFVSATYDLRHVEWYSLTGLRQYHDNNDASMITTVNLPSFPNDPRCPEATEFDKAWLDQVSLPLAARALRTYFDVA